MISYCYTAKYISYAKKSLFTIYIDLSKCISLSLRYDALDKIGSTGSSVNQLYLNADLIKSRQIVIQLFITDSHMAELSKA